MSIQSEHAPADGALLDSFIRAGDQDAFAQLMTRHGPYILRVCRNLTLHAQDAEDVYQACFLELARKASSIRKRASVVGWLHTVAARLSRKARRRRQRQTARDKTERLPTAVEPEDLSWREACRILEEEVAGLSDKLRLPIILCHFRGQTQEEAGHELALPVRTVKDRLRRGRDILRARLLRRGVSLAVLAAALSAGAVTAAVPAALAKATLCGVGAVVNKSALAGVVSPGAITLAGSGGGASVWALLGASAAAMLVAATGLYVHFNRSDETSMTPAAPPGRIVAAPTEQILERSFRGKQFDNELFKLVGPDAEQFVRQEEEGLRITLPAEKGPGDAVGVQWRSPVRGDFEVNATLEFLNIARPVQAWLTGVTLYVHLQSPQRDGLWVGKMISKGGGAVFHTGQRLFENGERVNKFLEAFPAQTKSGFARLRLARQGATFTFWAAEGLEEPLEELTHVEASSADVVILRFAADPVWSASTVIDARLVDFELKTKR